MPRQLWRNLLMVTASLLWGSCWLLSFFPLFLDATFFFFYPAVNFPFMTIRWQCCLFKYTCRKIVFLHHYKLIITREHSRMYWKSIIRGEASLSLHSCGYSSFDTWRIRKIWAVMSKTLRLLNRYQSFNDSGDTVDMSEPPRMVKKICEN